MKAKVFPKTKEDWEKLAHKFETALEKHQGWEGKVIEDWTDKLEFCYEHLGKLSNENIVDQAKEIFK